MIALAAAIVMSHRYYRNRAGGQPWGGTTNTPTAFELKTEGNVTLWLDDSCWLWVVTDYGRSVSGGQKIRTGYPPQAVLEVTTQIEVEP